MKLSRFKLTMLFKVLTFSIVSFVYLSGIPQSEAALFEKKGDNWKLKLNTLYAHDDNVATAPKDASLRPASMSKIGDSMFEWSGTGIYKYKPTAKLNVRMDYDIDMTIHSKLNDYNLTSQMFSLTPTYKFTPLMNAQLMYSYIWNIVDGDNFSGIHFVSPNFYYMHEKFGLTRLYYTYKYTDNWKYNTRDTSQNSFGINQFFFLFNNKGRVTVGYEYSSDNAQGSAFDRNLHNLSLRAKTPLIYGIDLDADGKYSIRSYGTRVADNGTDKRRDDQQRYSVKLSKVLSKKLWTLENITAYSKYRHVRNSTNLDVREYRSNRVDVGLRAQF